MKELLKEFKFPRKSYYLYGTKRFEILYYCKNCKKLTDNSVFTWSNGFATCSNCGERDNQYVTMNTGDRYKNIVLDSIRIDKDECKIAMTMVYLHPYVNTDVNKISWVLSTKRYVFNTETGQSYILPWTTSKGKFIGKGFAEFNHIVNATYGVKYGNSLQEYSIPSEVLEYLQEIIAPGKISASFDLNTLMLANRLPQLTNYQIGQAIDIQKQTGFYESNHFKDIFKGVKRNDTPKIFVEKVCKNLDVPVSKTIKKMILSMDNIKLLYDLKLYGFKDVNCKRSIVNSLRTNYIFNLYFEEYNPLIPFVKDLVRVKGDAAVAKMIVTLNELYEEGGNQEYNELTEVYGDCANMWHEFAEVEMNNDNYLKGNIHDIREHLLADIVKIRTMIENVPVKYTDAEKYLEGVYGDYIFSLVKNTRELIEAGSEMGNCVGNTWYTERTKKKEIYIILTTKDKSYKACIELTKELEMVQCKEKFNGTPTGSLANAIEEWVEDKNINAFNCEDFNRMISL